MAVYAFQPLKITPDLRKRIAAALAEDVGSGDATTQAVVAARTEGRAVILARERGIVCGLAVVEEVFRAADRRLRMRRLEGEGATVNDGDEVLEIRGRLGSILTGERVALNFLQRLSGIATLTRRYVKAARGRTQILDTRKTTPLWRDVEKYAVRVGGGVNHRFGLFDMVLIKNNHVDAAGGLGEAIRRVKARQGSGGRRRLPVMAEARSLTEVREAVAGGVDSILLDNFSRSRLRRALCDIPPAIETEASGGMTVARVAGLADLGLDRISVGALTHSAPAMDYSLRYRKP